MKNYFLTILTFATFLVANSQVSKEVSLVWELNQTELSSNNKEISKPYFKKVFYQDQNSSPCYVASFSSKNQITNGKIQISKEVYIELTKDDLRYLTKFNVNKNQSVKKIIRSGGDLNVIQFQIPTIVFDPYLLKWRKLISFRYEITPTLSTNKTGFTFKSGQTSPMNEGDWYKIGVTTTGIQYLNKAFFEQNGINISGVSPKNIRVFGYAQGMLPENISTSTPQTIPEIKGYFEGENDDSFDQNDYLIFYASAANTWDYNDGNQTYSHKKHLYSDTAYYFINVGSVPANRVENYNTPIDPITNSTNTYDYMSFHEVDKLNLIKTGREWYGEYFDYNPSQTFNFTVPNRASNSKAYFIAKMAIRSTTSSGNNIEFRANESLIHERFNVSNVNTSYTSNYAVVVTEKDSFDFSGNSLEFKIDYKQPINGAVAWLDYIEIQSKADLIFNGSSLKFSDKSNIGTNNISEYIITNSNANTLIWDITNPYNAKPVATTLTGDEINFISETDSLKTFIAFDASGYKTPFLSGKIKNQNLTGLTDIDYILITPPIFYNQTKKLADFHETHSGLTTKVVLLEEVYNEFSSGTHDIAAIRNFCKYLYDNADNTETRLKYLFLMGDGSYDPKHRILNNVDFIPTYQSGNSISPTSCFVSDDYYGMLDDINGISSSSSAVDIGIGRFPARNTTDATGFVNKVIHYSNTDQYQVVNSSSAIKTKMTYNDWKNKMLFVADDGSTSDGYTSAHVLQTEMIIDALLEEDSAYNSNKVYLDAYVKQSTAGGGRYPDVNREIREAMTEGAMFVSYIGHGGEAGWADERVLSVDEINSWNNIDAMPFFLTATCEFSRFDDPERTAAGEYVILNPNGGAIGMLTTTRLVYGGITNNIGFSINFFETVLPLYNNETIRLGDAIRITKTISSIGSNNNNRKFTLLGDPAMKMAFPKYKVATTKLNDVDINASPDTLKALSKIKIEGEIRDQNDQLIDINGFIYPTVYDKVNTITTLDNNNANSELDFVNRTSIIYKGIASVTNGKFSFEFIVPKDINYSYGNGRISYYFANDTVDGKGYSEKIIVGGSTDNLTQDNEGPQVQLFMNDTTFIFGGTTTSSPSIYAIINDSSGINTTGSSLGHNVTAVLDENYSESILLNDYYTSTLDDYQSGTIEYPLSSLADGKHNIRLKLWDVNNNSTEAYTEFVVASSADLALNHVLNYPNPFTTSTNFYFEHNQPGETLEVLIKIYTISGRLIKSISSTVNSTGNLRNAPIHWDGKDDFGDQIGRGVYMYKIEVQSADGKSAEQLEKLVILK